MNDPDHLQPSVDPDALQRAVDDVLDEAGEPAALPERVQSAVDSVLDEAEGGGAPLVRVETEPDPDPEERPKRETPPWADKLVKVLDDGIRVPGTDFRFGLDGIIGFFLPGIGDFLTGTGSAALLFLALREGVPTVAIGRMVFNILVDTVGGALPIIGDAFDIFWKSNRKNLDLIEKYRNEPDAQPGALDYILVFAGLSLILVSILMPFFAAWILASLGFVFFSSLFGD